MTIANQLLTEKPIKLYNNPYDSGRDSETEGMKYRHPRHVPHMTQLSPKPKVKMKRKTGQDRIASKSFREKPLRSARGGALPTSSEKYQV